MHGNLALYFTKKHETKKINEYLTILHVNNGLAPPGVRIFPSGD